MRKREINTQKSVIRHYHRLKAQLEKTQRMSALLLTIEPEYITEYGIFFDKNCLSLTAKNREKGVKVEVSWTTNSSQYFLEFENYVDYQDYLTNDVDKAAEKFIELLEKHLSK